MTADAFTLSVLLKQGEADSFINAKAGKRLDLLKKIVQILPYEKLSARIHDEVKTCGRLLDVAKESLKGCAAVSHEELTTPQYRSARLAA